MDRCGSLVLAPPAGTNLRRVWGLCEIMNRRRAVGGPAEQTFAGLVGLELRPRRLRDASRLWTIIGEEWVQEGRDDLWSHPDLQIGRASCREGVQMSVAVVPSE